MEVYSDLTGIFRGGGSGASPKLIAADGPRASDFSLIFDPTERCQMVIPDVTKGLSFSTTIERLQRLKIKGRVWKMVAGVPLPEGLVFNIKTGDPGHPLLNVSRKMPVLELLQKLSAVAESLTPTEVTIR